MIAISAVVLGEEVEQLVLEVLRSGHLVQGPMVERLEAGFCEIAGTRHAVAVSSGTTALVAAVECLGLRPGDEVITSPFTFVATLNAILEAGATATFADVDETFTLDPSAAAAEAGERTRVMMPVHLYGLPADMSSFASLSSEMGFDLVEDAAQAHGATVDGRPVGSFGLGCFSLYATKNMMTGEGGVITTDDDALADRLRVLRNQGMRARYQYELPGHNYRMTDLQAAVGVPQIARLTEVTERRRKNAARLTEGLSGVPGLVLPSEAPGRSHVWHQYTVRVTGDARIDRDELSAGLAERGVGSGVYYPRLVWDYPCFAEHPRVRTGHTPLAAAAAREVLSLPVHQHLSDTDVDRIVDAVREVLDA